MFFHQARLCTGPPDAPLARGPAAGGLRGRTAAAGNAGRLREATAAGVAQAPADAGRRAGGRGGALLLATGGVGGLVGSGGPAWARGMIRFTVDVPG